MSRSAGRIIRCRTRRTPLLLGSARPPCSAVTAPLPDVVVVTSVLSCSCRGRHSSTPPLCSGSPDSKCGLSLLSNIDSAEPMAMCMSRYL